MNRYSLGFAFSPDNHHLLLIKKNRPDFLKGRWSGIGGHIEANESPSKAMEREFMEECGLNVPAEDWKYLGCESDRETYELHVFFTHTSLDMAQTLTDERVEAFPIHTLPENLAQSVSTYLQKIGVILAPDHGLHFRSGRKIQ